MRWSGGDWQHRNVAGQTVTWEACLVQVALALGAA
jgi:hypothetical protein